MHFMLWLGFILIFSVVQVAESAELKIILRYDDYTQNSNIDVEWKLFETAKNINGGVLVGVIPFPKSAYPDQKSSEQTLQVNLDDKKIGFLKNYASNGIVEIAVHGFSHKSNTVEIPNSEFMGLSEDKQNLLLATGKKSLEEAFGLQIVSFVPPFNAYDIQTLKSLGSNGYKLISAGSHGPILHDGKLTYLPGGPYPQRLKDVVMSAITKGHTDATVVSSMHPYDILEGGGEIPEFRRGQSQIAIKKLIDDLHEINQLKDVKFMPISELFDGTEDLSPDRLQANHKLRRSYITHHRLLPAAFNIYPLTGLYYSQDYANRMYTFQIAAFTLFYGALILVITLMTRAILRRFRSHFKNTMALTVTVSIVGIFALLAKSLSSGFYMTSAVGLVCCISVLVGAATNWRRTASKTRITNDG